MDEAFRRRVPPARAGRALVREREQHRLLLRGRGRRQPRVQRRALAGHGLSGAQEPRTGERRRAEVYQERGALADEEFSIF